MAVITDELVSPAAVFQPFGHRYPDGLVVVRWRVATYVPEHGIVLVPLAQKLAKGICVFGVEHPLRMVILDVPRLGGDQAHHKTQLVGAIDDVVHVLENSSLGRVGSRSISGVAPRSDLAPSGWFASSPRRT